MNNWIHKLFFPNTAWKPQHLLWQVFKLVFKQSQEEQTNKKRLFTLFLSCRPPYHRRQQSFLNLRLEWRVIDAGDDMCADQMMILACLMLLAHFFTLLLDSSPHHRLLFCKLFQFWPDTRKVCKWLQSVFSTYQHFVLYRERLFQYPFVCEIFQCVFLLTSSFNLYGSRIFQRHVLDQTGWVW